MGSFLKRLHERFSLEKALILNKCTQMKLVANTLSLSRKIGSSCSDDNFYNFACYMASKHEKVFKNFRRNKIYCGVLEHVSKTYGNEYLKIINASNLFTRDDFMEFQKNDLYGNPLKFSFYIGNEKFDFAPTTLRYAKNLCDILSFFDVSDIRSIAEIGVGYGGLCRLICHKLELGGGYNLIDLPEAIGLAERFLSHFEECLRKVKFIDGLHLYKDIDSDLLISNYAFSELQREVQDMYLEKVILNSKHGFITWNNLGQNSLNAYSVSELLKIIPNSKTIDEKPLTAKENCVIIWGYK